MTLPEVVVMLSITPINEVRLVALFVLLAAALVTGSVAGLVSGWRHGSLGRLAGLALGLAVGVAAVVVVALMVEEPSRPQLALIEPADAGSPMTEEPDAMVWYTSPANGPLTGEVTLVWALLYPIQVGAVVLCTWFAATRLWSVARLAARLFPRSER